jgi:isocitrate dehydrogenase (NAD+)
MKSISKFSRIVNCSRNFSKQPFLCQNNKFTYTQDGKLRVTLFAGHGIGPEITQSVCQILEKAGANISWVSHNIGEPVPGSNELVSREALDSVLDTKVALKGPLATPIGKGYRSLNITLRKALELYANVRPAKGITSLEKQFKGVNMVIIRENTEGEYSGLEHEIIPGVVESLKVITRDASMRIAKYAFAYAKEHGRKKVTVVHKANIMKMSDGLFMNCCREVSKSNPEIEYVELNLDAACMNMAKSPSEFDIIVTTNLYGDIVSDLAAGLIGGLGLTPSGNYGESASVFEAVHGTAPDIAGRDLANPTALLLSAVMMLKHVGMNDSAHKIEKSLEKIWKEKTKLTGDLGGKATCSQFTNSVIEGLSQ